MKLKGTIDGELKKRTYVDIPGEFSMPCPKCGENVKINVPNGYLSYPETGDEDAIGTYCDKCEHEDQLPFKVTDISIELDVDFPESASIKLPDKGDVDQLRVDIELLKKWHDEKVKLWSNSSNPDLAFIHMDTISLFDRILKFLN